MKDSLKQRFQHKIGVVYATHMKVPSFSFFIFENVFSSPLDFDELGYRRYDTNHHHHAFVQYYK